MLSSQISFSLVPRPLVMYEVRNGVYLVDIIVSTATSSESVSPLCAIAVLA